MLCSPRDSSRPGESELSEGKRDGDSGTRIPSSRLLRVTPHLLINVISTRFEMVLAWVKRAIVWQRRPPAGWPSSRERSGIRGLTPGWERYSRAGVSVKLEDYASWTTGVHGLGFLGGDLEV